jgi:hypothetical protein
VTGTCVDPGPSRARLSCRRAAALFREHTGWSFHPLRHHRNVAGFDELLDGLAQDPMTTADLLTLLKNRLGDLGN